MGVGSDVRTASEQLFEELCLSQALDFDRVPTADYATPDYRIRHKGEIIYFEIKQIEGRWSGVPSSRQTGSHLRSKVRAASRQMKTAAKQGCKAVLLVMNNFDPLQMFGTEQTDFIAAMYGDWELKFESTGRVREAYYGPNRKFRPDVNESFSGLGFIKRTEERAEVTVYENIYAAHRIDSLPDGFELLRFRISTGSPK